MSQEPPDQPLPAPTSPAQASAVPPVPPQPPAMPPAERVRAASQRRSETDYIFDYWSALGWTILTLGIYGFYILYQLVRRMREHNICRLELFDASIAAAW